MSLLLVGLNYGVVVGKRKIRSLHTLFWRNHRFFFSFLFSVPENTKREERSPFSKIEIWRPEREKWRRLPNFFPKGSIITAKDCEQLSRKFFFVTCPCGDTCHKCTNAFTHLAKAVVPIKYTTLNAHSKKNGKVSHYFPFSCFKKERKILGNLLTYPPLDFFFFFCSAGNFFRVTFSGGCWRLLEENKGFIGNPPLRARLHESPK